MKGTAILFREDQHVTIIEDIDLETYEEIKEKCECKSNKELHPVFPVSLWHEEAVDWDYGY